MNKCLLEAFTQLRTVDRLRICEDLRIGVPYLISDTAQKHALRVLTSVEKHGIVRELEAAMLDYQ